MALIKCSECGKKVSDKAEICINCGAPIEVKKVKQDENEKVDEDLNYLRNYIKRDKIIKIVILIILGLVITGVAMSIISKNHKEREKNLEIEKRWMKESEGYYSDGWNSIEMDGKGSARLCVGVGRESITGVSMSKGCTYPHYTYESPNGYKFSGDNNFADNCTVTCSYWETNPDLLTGLTCTKSNGEEIWIPKIDSKTFRDYVKCGEE